MKPHPFIARLKEAELVQPCGTVRGVSAGAIRASGPSAAPGALCLVERETGDPILAEVVAVEENCIRLMPLDQVGGIKLDARVIASSRADRAPVGDRFGGRLVDALGRPLDGRGAIVATEQAPVCGAPPRPLARRCASSLIASGIRAIDGLLPLAEGQRIGIFAASGVGKTSLIEQLAVQIPADRCILCLVGERGREVEAMSRLAASQAEPERFTVVAATSDESAAMRARAVDYALCLAEHWRAAGEHVLLIVDSVTRYAMALREIGLAAGAPPTVRAYTPNVFAALPRVVERCGALRGGGAITAVMTVLSETDDIDDPIVELMKSLLDGHILLSRSLAEQGHFPAIDATRSVSRGADRLVEPGHAAAMRQAVAMLGAYEEARVMIESGVYKAGTNPGVDRSIKAREPLLGFLKQGRDESVPFEESVRKLRALLPAGTAHA